MNSWMNEWMNQWMNKQIIERWRNWMLYSWRKAHLFILDLKMQSVSYQKKKSKNRSFLVILTPRCVAICAVTWSFPFIWPTCDSRTYHWFNSKGPKKFSRSCICPNPQLICVRGKYKLYRFSDPHSISISKLKVWTRIDICNAMWQDDGWIIHLCESRNRKSISQCGKTTQLVVLGNCIFFSVERG